MDEGTAREIAKLFASKFIARPDIKAHQKPNGDWYPDETPITMADLLAHLQGKKSMGHYMLSRESKVKLFAFDIDFQKADEEKNAWWPMPSTYDEDAGEWTGFVKGNPRLAWESLTAPDGIHHDFLGWQMMDCARTLVRAIEQYLQVPYAVSYSGHKGVHVYGFTGLCSAEEARDGAMLALELSNSFETWRGKNFFVGKNKFADGTSGWPQLSVEVFPKQINLEGQKGFGNLMRLPLGVNLLRKPAHPHHAKFIDMRHQGKSWLLTERDPIEALTVTDQLAGAIPK